MPGMTATPTTLQSGAEVRCPRCHRWHSVEQRKIGSTTYADAMLFVVCGGAAYYVGNIGTPSRHLVRSAG
jgi:hypothetical protein